MLETGYGIMPNSILFDKDITDKQKLIFCLVSSLCAEKGYCWASNNYIGEKLGCKERTISHGLGQLLVKGYLDIENKEDGKRIITIDKVNPYVKNHIPPCEKSQGGGSEKSHTNNIIDNNTMKEELEEFSQKRSNAGVGGYKQLPKVVKITDPLYNSRCIKRKKYTIDEIKQGVNNYVMYIVDGKKKEPEKKYRDHRFTLQEFLHQSNGLDKFINLSPNS